MIRVVADSNVYISAINFGGVADEVLALGRRQVIALFVSPSILKEVEASFGMRYDDLEMARESLSERVISLALPPSHDSPTTVSPQARAAVASATWWVAITMSPPLCSRHRRAVAR